MFKQGGPGSGGVLPERGSEEDVVDDGVHPPVHLNDRVEQILDQGYTIFEDFCTEQEIADIRHAFNTEVPITQMAAIGTETGLTLRAHNLLAKTRACDWLFLDPRLRKLVKGVLGPLVQVNVTTLFNTLPGETRQFLHQDDGLWPIARPHPSFICNALLAIDDFDEEVGSTHVVPHSHKMNDVVPHNKHPDEIQVKMKSGSMIMWEGGLWHGGGANTTSVEAGNYRERMGFFMSHSVGYLRPQEIQVTTTASPHDCPRFLGCVLTPTARCAVQLVSVPRPIVQQMPKLLQRLLGYHRFGIGVDGRDPVDVLENGDEIETYWSPDARLADEQPAYADRSRL